MTEPEAREKYFTLLKGYVIDQGEQYLVDAAELGRRLVQSEVREEDVIEIHDEALQRLARELPKMLLADAAIHISFPLLELFMAYSLASRQKREDQQRLEVQLHHAHKMEAIGTLAAGIAHEINTPVQFVSSNTLFLHNSFKDLQPLFQLFTRMMAAKEEMAEGLIDEVRRMGEKIDLEFMSEDIPEAIDDSLEGLQQIARIVRAMKEFSHPGTETKTAVDINKAIETTVEVSRNAWRYNAEMVTELAPELPSVPCLPGEINQVFLNLIVNAAQAIGETRTEGSEELGTITISTGQDQEEVVITVRDSGCGMNKEVQSRVFDPFFTTKEVGRGTGQGLSLVYSTVVDRHGGTITVESEAGQGTIFEVRLPVAPLSG